MALTSIISDMSARDGGRYLHCKKLEKCKLLTIVLTPGQVLGLTFAVNVEYILFESVLVSEAHEGGGDRCSETIALWSISSIEASKFTEIDHRARCVDTVRIETPARSAQEDIGNR